MTTGSILKKICIFALPCIIGRVLQNLYSLIDSVIVGQAIDATALAAVGATGSIISLFTETVIGLMSGFSVTASKHYGAENKAAVKKVFSHSLIVTAAVSLMITVFGALFSRQMLTLMKTPAELMDTATLYLQIIFLGISTSVFYNFLCEMLRALGNSRQPLFFLFYASVIHILLIFLFLYAFDLGVVGAALSTVLSQAAAVLMCVLFIFKKVPDFKLARSDFKLSKKTFNECFKIGIPMAITNFVVMFGVMILSFITNTIGTEYVAAYSCASKIGYIITTPLFGFASAASFFVAQNLGAGKLDRVIEGVRKTNLLATGVNCVLFVISIFTLRPMLSFILKGEEFAVEAGMLYLIIRCIAMFILTFAAVYKNVLNGLGCPFFPAISGFLEIAARFIIPISLSKPLGFASVPLTDAITWMMLALFLTPAYFYEIKKLKKARSRAQALNV